MNKAKEKLQEIYTKFFSEKTLKELIGELKVYGSDYSLFNQLFLYCQATNREISYQGIVKPFSKWKKEKTFIKSGEHSLKVLCPTFAKMEVCNTCNLIKVRCKCNQFNPIQAQFLKGFIEAPVFDVSQTNSKDFQEYMNKKEVVIYTNDLGLDYEFIKTFVLNNFTNKLIEDIKEIETKGSFNLKTKEITMHRKDAQTLLHEFSHYLTEGITNEYALNEVIAEITTYLISRKLGSKGYNFNYSNCWSSQIKEKDFNEFVKIFSKIDKKIRGLKWKQIENL